MPWTRCPGPRSMFKQMVDNDKQRFGQEMAEYNMSPKGGYKQRRAKKDQNAPKRPLCSFKISLNKEHGMISTLYLNFTDLSFFSASKERERHNPQHWDVCKGILFFTKLSQDFSLLPRSGDNMVNVEMEQQDCTASHQVDFHFKNRSHTFAGGPRDSGGGEGARGGGN